MQKRKTKAATTELSPIGDDEDDFTSERCPLCKLPVFGTFETCRDVRSMVAIGGKADVARIAHFGSD